MTNMQTIEQKLIQWDENIKSGHSEIAQYEIFNYLKSNKVNKELRLDLAAILRRLGHYDKAVKLLFSIVRPSDKNPILPSQEEIVEYAASLIQSGGVIEGRKLLIPIDHSAVPQRDLFLAFSYFAEWDYESAYPILQRYVNNKQLSLYQILIGQVNFLAALVSTQRFDEAFELLFKLKREFKSNNQRTLLLANCLEIETQLLINTNKFEFAIDHLNQIQKLFSGLGAPYSFYLKKWSLVAQLQNINFSKDGVANEKMISDFILLREEAFNLKYSEVVRDCDYWISHFTKNSKLMSYVYYGTPWLTYKNKILKSNPWFVLKIDELVWPIDYNSNVLSQKKFDPISLKKIYKNWELPTRALQILLSDFYADWSLGRLHDLLYPDEYFNPQSSPLKMKQIAFRTRKFLQQNNFAITLNIQNNKWSLSSKRKFHFLDVDKTINLKSKKDESLSQFHAQLKLVFPNLKYYFSSSEVCKLLKITERKCRLLLQDLVQKKILKRCGVLKSTKYTWVN